MITEGAFVRVLFPTTEKPRHPGLLHICYCLAVRPPLVLAADTTSVEWPRGTPLPFGVRLFTTEEARALNQAQAFSLHLNRLARIPLTRMWIPDLDADHQGVIAVAPRRLRQELYEVTVQLHKRYQHAVERLGL